MLALIARLHSCDWCQRNYILASHPVQPCHLISCEEVSNYHVSEHLYTLSYMPAYLPFHLLGGGTVGNLADIIIQIILVYRFIHVRYAMLYIIGHVMHLYKWAEFSGWTYYWRGHIKVNLSIGSSLRHTKRTGTWLVKNIW